MARRGRRRGNRRNRGGVRRRVRRRGLLGRVNRPIKAMTHKFIRFATNDINLDLTSGLAPNQSFSALTFTLDNVQNTSEFKNLYDQYRILGVKIYMNWSPYVGGSVVPTNAIAPVLSLFTDYDDNSTPTEGDFRSRAVTKMFRMNGPQTYFFKPAVLGSLYESGVATGYGPQWGRWIDCADSALPYYGLKLWARGIDGLNVGKVNLRFKYYLEMKGSR